MTERPTDSKDQKYTPLKRWRMKLTRFELSRIAPSVIVYAVPAFIWKYVFNSIRFGTGLRAEHGEHECYSIRWSSSAS
jgi:hypothetical protein